ncbi:MAG: NAD(P)/FAD-dependent oxidoreductase [Bacillales bacterium]|jgi:protoporphyrinogen oxidase|nr:NAD(P)/FAD-dependent oxidoreductase [Bacillales bacterium]
MKKAIIIGAGPAGLTTAYKLLKETDYIPFIIESENVPGGISKTLNYKGNRMDIGGHRFFSKSSEVNELWRTFVVEQGQPSQDDLLLNRTRTFVGKGDPEKEDNVFLVRNRVSRIYYLRKFFDYPVSLKYQTIKNMGFKRTMKVGFGYLGTKFRKLKEDNLENFYINRFGRPLYAMFFESYTTKVWGVEPKNIDASWGAQRVKGLSLWKAITSMFAKKKETSLIDEYYYPKYGPGQLYEIMARKIIELGGTILYNTEVKDIIVKENKIEKLLDTQGNEYVGDVYISSEAIKDLVNGIENAPKEVKDVATNLPYRDFVTVGLLVSKLEIQNTTKTMTVNNIVPDCWIYLQEPDVKIGRLQIFNNWSPYLVKDFADKIWIGLEYFCNEGDELWNKEENEFVEFAKEELEKIGIIKKENVLDGARYRVKKAYPAYFEAYHSFPIVKDYLLTITNLYCIGRNGQHRYNNMDHSMLTGLRTVEAIQGLISKEEVWQVNSEEDYHESKKK